MEGCPTCRQDQVSFLDICLLNIPCLSVCSFRPILRILTFANAGQFVNLSRVSPLLIYGRPIGESRREVCTGGNTAVCLSTIMITQSSLASDFPGLKFPYRGLKGIGHAGKHERAVALLTMLAGVETIYGQFWDSAWTYQTKNSTGSAGTSSILHFYHL